MPKLGKSDQRAKISANEWNRRRLGALAKLRELQLAIAQGKLVEVAKVEAEWTRIAIQLRQAVMGIPGRIVNRIPAEFRSEVLRAAEDEVRQVLVTLSNQVRNPRRKKPARAGKERASK